MGETLGEVVGYEKGSSNEISDGFGVGEIEGYTLGESIGSFFGAEISSSGGRSGGKVAGNPDGYPLGGSYDGI